MCGITGAIWNDPRRAIEPSTLDRMTALLTHRGPDDSGVYHNVSDRVGIALGHRRLSIIGVETGHQPIENEDGSIQIVFNGEIYNYRELRERLMRSGHRFRTDSDTEVIVHLYEEDGLDTFDQLNGMFAIAIWDARQRQLVLARDRSGQKPLFYRTESDRLLFASELKSIVEVEDVPREINPIAVDEYLTYQYVPHPLTIYRGISKLAPGHLATWKADTGEFTASRYWTPNFGLENRTTSKEQWTEQLDELLADSVKLRMQSEVPLGAFLSGGVDSSIIVGLMQEQSNQTVRTFSIGFPIKEYDETRFARQVANHLGTEHEEFIVEPQALDIIPKLVWHYDEPFADSSAIPTWYVSQMTRQHVTVSLTGDGGDELFCGYPRYKAVMLGRWFDRMPSPVRRMLSSPIWQKIPSSTRQKSTRRRLKRFLEALGQSPLERYLQWIAIFNRSRRNELYESDFAASLCANDSLDFLRDAKSRSNHRDPVTSICLTDLITYLPCDLMTKVDIASMAHSLECRQPFLDHRVVQLASQIPISMKLRGGQGKKILVDTFRRFLPDEIQNRPKMGFGVPLDHWFRGPLADYTRDILTDSRTENRGMFRPDIVRQMLDDHVNNRFDHAYRIWSLLMLELWQREWIDR